MKNKNHKSKSLIGKERILIIYTQHKLNMKTLKSIPQDSERNYKVTTIIYKFTLNQSKFKKLYEWIIKQRAIHKQRRPPPICSNSKWYPYSIFHQWIKLKCGFTLRPYFDLPMAYSSSLLHAIITCNHLPFFKIFPILCILLCVIIYNVLPYLW